MAQATLLPRPCEGCGEPLPLDAHPGRKRHEACAYAKVLADALSRSRSKVYQPVVRTPVRCVDCPATFTPKPQGAIPIRCPECRPKAVLRWKAEARQRNAIKVPIDATRPCGRAACTQFVHRSGKVYARYCSDDCKPRCTLDGCEEPARKKTWCAGHYSQWQRTGKVAPFKYKHAEKRDLCLACNEPFEMDGYREFCNAACRAYWFAFNGEIPKCVYCINCFIEIPIGKVKGRTRRQRFDIRVCRRCKQDLRKYGISAEQLATRDGAICQLCSGAVNMRLRAPDPGCPSVDHRFPVSKGGTNDPENLQLAHLRCNIIKADRLLEEYLLAA